MSDRGFLNGFSFEIFYQQDDDTYQQQKPYKRNNGYHIPNQNGCLFFEMADDRLLIIKREWRVRNIEFDREIV